MRYSGRKSLIFSNFKCVPNKLTHQPVCPPVWCFLVYFWLRFCTYARECVVFVCFHAPSLTSGILSLELDSLVDSFSFFPTMTEASSSSPRVHLFFSSRWRQREWRKIWILFEAVSLCFDVLLVSSPQLSWNLPRASSLLRSCPKSPIPEDDSCAVVLVVGKLSSMHLYVLLRVIGLELVVWLEEHFHSCSTRKLDASL